jgi:hypothetical protein
MLDFLMAMLVPVKLVLLVFAAWFLLQLLMT